MSGQVRDPTPGRGVSGQRWAPHRPRACGSASCGRRSKAGCLRGRCVPTSLRRIHEAYLQECTGCCDPPAAVCQARHHEWATETLNEWPKVGQARMGDGHRLTEPGLTTTVRERGGAAAARRAHNPKVVGSNPTPATNRLHLEPRARPPGVLPLANWGTVAACPVCAPCLPARSGTFGPRSIEPMVDPFRDWIGGSGAASAPVDDVVYGS